MKCIHIHERLRQEILRTIRRRSLSVTLLAKQTGLAPAHISNFLRQKRRLSLTALDRILSARHLEAEDLLPSPESRGETAAEEIPDSVPIVSCDSALFEPVIRSFAVLAYLPLLPGSLNHLLPRATSDRRRWQRFVAVRISSKDAELMSPVLFSGSIVVIDRHYNSTRRYDPDQPTLYAARHDAQLVVRYVDFVSDKLVLRPRHIDAPVELLEIPPGTKPQDLITGRVVLILNPM